MPPRPLPSRPLCPVTPPGPWPPLLLLLLLAWAAAPPFPPPAARPTRRPRPSAAGTQTPSHHDPSHTHAAAWSPAGGCGEPGAGLGPLVSSTHLELQLGARAWPPPAWRCTDSAGHTSDWAAVRGTIPTWHGSPGCTGRQAHPAARPVCAPRAAADRPTCERVVLAPRHTTVRPQGLGPVRG